MAWNGSSGGSTPTVKPAKKAGKTSPALKGALAGLLVIAGAVAAFFYLMPSEEPVVKNEIKAKKIKEVKPSLPKARPAVEESVTEVPKVDPKARPKKTGEIVNGYIKLASGRIHKIRGAYTNYISQVKSDYEIFDHYCENEIACLITLKPGDTLVGTPSYRGAFREDFIESLKQPIIVKETDSERDKELKRAVNDAKIELKAALDRGEDIERIMIDSRAESQRLAEYRMFLKDELLDRARDENLSAEDYQDLLEAGNKMLEAQGIAPMKPSAIMRRKLMYDARVREGK